MESNKNNNNNGGDEHQQLGRSARKRKLNELANDGKPGAAGEDQIQQEQSSSSKMNREEKNDQHQQDLEIVQLPLPQPHADENEEQAEEEEDAELPILQPMKVQLSKETWFDMLESVGRRQLGQIVPLVGDRRFAWIVQPFLHNYGHITLANICISGPRHRLIQHPLDIPENVNDFLLICLSYLSTPVINLLQKFKQNALFGNVNLDLRLHSGMITKTFLKTLSRVLPSIDNINSIRGDKIAQLAGLYNANSEMAMTMLKMTRFLDIFNDYIFAPDEIAFLNRWLHTPRDDGKPRVLILPANYLGPDAIDKILLFIDGTIKLEFAKAKLPVCFFIRFFVRDTVDWHDSSMENGETKEKLLIKKVESGRIYPQQMALISRYPRGAGKHWIEANEQEIVDWNFVDQNGCICLGYPIRNAIGSKQVNWPHNDANADGEDDG